jgi:hypothetical protein
VDVKDRRGKNEGKKMRRKRRKRETRDAAPIRPEDEICMYRSFVVSKQESALAYCLADFYVQPYYRPACLMIFLPMIQFILLRLKT